MSAPKPTGPARSRLASRTSFFGGPVSTREESRAPGWRATVTASQVHKPAAKSTDTPSPGPLRGSEPRRGGQASSDRTQGPTKADLFRASFDFSDLGSSSACLSEPKPAAKSAQGLSKDPAGAATRPWSASPDARTGHTRTLGGHDSRSGTRGQGHGSAGRSMVSGPRSVSGHSRGALPPENGQASTGNPSRDPGSTHRMVFRAPAPPGRRRKADKARTSAVQVAAVGSGRKQLAASSLRSKVDAVVMAKRRQSTSAPIDAEATSMLPASAVPRFQGRAPMAVRTPLSSAAGKTTVHLVRSAGPPGVTAGASRPGPSAVARSAAGAEGNARTGESGQPRAVPSASRKQQAAFRGTFYGSQQPLPSLQRKRKQEDEYDSGLDDFIEPGSPTEAADDWRAALRDALGGYDPAKYAQIDRLDDRAMEVTRYADIAQEETRSLRIAREVDRREAEEEAMRLARKEEVRRKKRGTASFLDDD